jgi:hypothetical protein
MLPLRKEGLFLGAMDNTPSWPRLFKKRTDVERFIGLISDHV